MKTVASIDISRREFLATGAFAVASACVAPCYLTAQTQSIVPGALKEAALTKIRVQTLRRGVSVLLGPGGNIAVLTGPDGKLLVDSEIVTARPRVSEALASVNADPVNPLINTHWHFDHAGGDEWVHEAGASILAHENTRKHLSQDTRVEGNFSYSFPAMPTGALPSTIFKEEHTLHTNNSTLLLKHYQPAHTDSDISVHFVEADILHTGDTFWNRDYHFIDYWTGGRIDGQIRAAEANIARVTDKTIVIPGHGFTCSVAADGSVSVYLAKPEGTYQPWWDSLRIEVVGLQTSSTHAFKSDQAVSVITTPLGTAATMPKAKDSQTILFKEVAASR